MTDKDPRVILAAGEVSIDADPIALGDLFHNLIHDEEFRSKFEKDPVGGLAEVGISVPEDMRDKITPENINAAIAASSEGSREQQAVFAVPGVAVGVRVGTSPGIRAGTNPGTAPAVRVGVRVATGTSTFADAKPLETEAKLIEELSEEAKKSTE